MTPLPQLGKLLIVIGGVIAVLGMVLLFSGKIPWFGRLPGDFHFRGKHVSFYFPLATSLLISIILTIILWLIGKK
ncbi:MAG TPA: DUF2905 domain-containing protein [Syntrophales bacterium]|jgi:hypothetical protein|nr:DUF2905 domain-containing protein [Syntrophales bacterium]HQA82007.1 DUF2905 domain-containing protein [Syntrophales bacterium]